MWVCFIAVCQTKIVDYIPIKTLPLREATVSSLSFIAPYIFNAVEEIKAENLTNEIVASHLAIIQLLQVSKSANWIESIILLVHQWLSIGWWFGCSSRNGGHTLQCHEPAGERLVKINRFAWSTICSFIVSPQINVSCEKALELVYQHLQQHYSNCQYLKQALVGGLHPAYPIGKSLGQFTHRLICTKSSLQNLSSTSTVMDPRCFSNRRTLTFTGKV